MSDDLISREALKKAIKNLYNETLDGIVKFGIEKAYEEIDSVPTVRPQDKWGKWVISEIRCPNCLEYYQTDCYSTEELKKCPNCGAKMTTGDEEAKP